MEIIKNIKTLFLASLIGSIYSYLSYIVGYYYVSNCKNNNGQILMNIQILSGIFALIMGFVIFEKIYKNTELKIGFIMGGILLMLYSLIFNWCIIDDITKIILIGTSLFGVIIYVIKNS